MFKLYFFLISEISSQLQEKSGLVTWLVLIPETFNWSKNDVPVVSIPAIPDELPVTVTIPEDNGLTLKLDPKSILE